MPAWQAPEPCRGCPRFGDLVRALRLSSKKHPPHGAASDAAGPRGGLLRNMPGGPCSLWASSLGDPPRIPRAWHHVADASLQGCEVMLMEGALCKWFLVKKMTTAVLVRGGTELRSVGQRHPPMNKATDTLQRVSLALCPFPLGSHGGRLDCLNSDFLAGLAKARRCHQGLVCALQLRRLRPLEADPADHLEGEHQQGLANT